MRSMPTEYLTATLLRRAPVTPSVTRLTFAVPGFRSTGAPDEWVHIFLGEPGDHQRRRNYTIRAVRGEEVDVDVVLHDRGLMVGWTRAAQPGDTLVWGDVTGSYDAPADTDWRLIAGDITALPAIGRIVEELPAGARATVVVETADAGDRQTWETQGDVEYVWMQGAEASKLEHAVRAFPEPEGNGYRWMAGETRTVRATRRHVRHERGIPKERYSLTGYWLDDYEAWEARYAKVAAEMEALWVEGEAQGRDVEDIMDDYDEALEKAGL
jgi:NADPH-dependent ferric siderophore reductase